MESRNRYFSFVISILLISSNLALLQAQGFNGRQNLEIIIGGGAYPPDTYSPADSPLPQPPFCPDPIPPPPPPPECPPPQPPPVPSPPPPPPPVPSHPPPPPPTPKPQLPPPKQKPKPKPKPGPPSGKQSPELERAKVVIEKFRKTVKHDPMNVTGTWNGRICEGSNYRGFICDTTISDGKKRVALVKFNGFDLGGNSTNPLALKDFLDGLTDLIVFHSNTNGYSGSVPGGIDYKRLPYLYELDLSNNKLTGGFPLTVLTAVNLTFLDLRFNFLTGEVPAAAFRLDLDVLFLNNNQFSGKIPDNLGETPSLYVTLANNKFTGRIPKSIGQASHTLLEILLLNNHLSGCLPYEIGLLKSATLFDASVNRITGPIPLSFGCLDNLNYLNISHNLLYGRVPESLCRLGNVVSITLNDNFITEVGPACRALIAAGKLDVRMNCIRDLPSQKNPGECGQFFSREESCPDPESMNIVPCHRYAELPGTTRKLLSLPRTYAALQPQP